MELKIVVQNEIDTYLESFFRLCILFAHENDGFYLWFYSNFLLIHSKVNFQLRRYDVKYSDTPFEQVLEQKYISYSQIEDKSDILALIKKQITNSKYLIVNVDEFFLEPKICYKKQHYVHPSLIYGFDDESQKLLAVGFNANNLLSKLTYDYENFTAGFIEGEKYYKPVSWKIGEHTICIIEPKKDLDSSVFDFNQYCRKLKNYIYPKHNSWFAGMSRVLALKKLDSMDIIQADRMTQKKYNKKIRQYGINILNFLENNLVKTHVFISAVDYRIFHFLYNHRLHLFNSLQFVSSLLHNKCIGEWLGRYENVLSLYKSMKVFYLKTIMREGKLNSHNKVVNDKKILESIKKKIKILKKREKYILFKIYKNLKKFCHRSLKINKGIVDGNNY